MYCKCKWQFISLPWQGIPVACIASSYSTPLHFLSHAVPSPTDRCASKICSENTTCILDSAGAAVCVCKPGFLPQPDGVTCAGTFRCPATCGSCPAGATCTVAFGYIPYCICPPSYGMTSTGCVSGATPTVSSTSITFYDQPNYTITPTTFTTRLDFNACTTLPALVASRVRSYLRIDGAPGGLGECVALNQYSQEGCAGAYTSCANKICGGNGTCVQDSAGVPTCVCNAGFLLQPDGCPSRSFSLPCALSSLFVASVPKPCVHFTPFHSPPTEACGTKICDPTTDCVRDAAGGATCPLCLRVLQPDVPCCAAPCRDVLGGAVQLFSSHFPIFPGPAAPPHVGAALQGPRALLLSATFHTASALPAMASPASAASAVSPTTLIAPPLTPFPANPSPFSRTRLCSLSTNNTVYTPAILTCIVPSVSSSTMQAALHAFARALPTVSSTSITFYDQPNYTITPTTFTTRLDFNACTTLPALVASRVRSYLRIDGVPGGMGECVALNQYSQEGCVGAYTSYNGMSTPTGMGAVGYV
ncbi:unnamed protein product [Closterium sp. NIES-65]|nr:unnamed protein product [Closterium sp. NIES-65]